MNAHADPRSATFDVKAAAEGISERLRALAQSAEDLRRVPDESIALVKKSGLMRVLQPKSVGGHEMSMRDHVDAIAGVARACNATGWVLGVYHAHSWLIGHMDPQAQQDAYGEDPDRPVSAVIGPRGRAVRKADGSYVLTGFWPFASGIAAAKWIILGAEVFSEDGTPLDQGDLLVPVADVEVLDDWRVAGLQGTGSCSVRCTNASVPAHRYVSLVSLLEYTATAYTDPNAPTLYKSPAGPVLGLCIASGATGVARGALDEFLKVVPGKAVMYTAHISHQWTPLQVAVGEAAGMIHAAELVLYRVADDIDDFARRGAGMPMELHARIRFDIANVARLCRDAVEKLYTIGGAAGLSLKSPIQRAARNLQATNMHGLLLYDSGAEIYGRVLLGVGPGTPVL